MTTNNVHHMYTICTPITKHTFCTLNVQTMYNQCTPILRLYTKVLYKGSLQRLYTYVVAKSFLRRTYRKISFKGFPVSVSSLDGNCQAFGEVSVISSPEPLAKNGQGVATLSRAAKGRERCGDRYLPRPLADTTLPNRISSGLSFNSLRLTGPAYWKHIVIKTNN